MRHGARATIRPGATIRTPRRLVIPAAVQLLARGLHEPVEARAVFALGALLELCVNVESHLRVGVADLIHDPEHVEVVG